MRARTRSARTYTQARTRTCGIWQTLRSTVTRSRSEQPRSVPCESFWIESSEARQLLRRASDERTAVVISLAVSEPKCTCLSGDESLCLPSSPSVQSNKTTRSSSTKKLHPHLGRGLAELRGGWTKCVMIAGWIDGAPTIFLLQQRFLQRCPPWRKAHATRAQCTCHYFFLATSQLNVSSMRAIARTQTLPTFGRNSVGISRNA